MSNSSRSRGGSAAPARLHQERPSPSSRRCGALLGPVPPFPFWPPGDRLLYLITSRLPASSCSSSHSVGKESACNAGDPGWIPGSGRSPGEGIGNPLQNSWASLVAQLLKNPAAMQETWVQSLGWEDPLEKGKATHSCILPGEFHGLYSPWGHKESDVTEQLSL